MLMSLRVKNLALVEEVQVAFEPGLNIITGETGAGKSIVIGALGLLLGERADKSLIRAGEEVCSVEAVFALHDPETLELTLESLGLDPLEEGQLILRRLIRSNGGGQVWVNDQPVTVQALRTIGDHLVDMHGPYDHQSLLCTDVQRDILDAFGHCYKARDIYEKHYAELRDMEQRIAACDLPGDEAERQLEHLSYTVKELEEAHLSETEEEEVLQEHAVFGNAQQIMEWAQTVAQHLTDGETAAVDLLATAIRALDGLARLLPEAEAWQQEVEEASIRIRETAAALALRMDQVDADPARLDWLDQRITTYQRMKRKYGPTVSDALAHLDQSRARLEELQQREDVKAQRVRERDRIRETLCRAGDGLHAERAKAAEKLGKAITKELVDLGFTHGQFEVQVVAGEPNAAGLDTVEFVFEPNVGEGMRALRLIASSGEISRVMLATKAVLAGHDQIPVLVFDEIDANIGGETGGAVGRKLARVAGHHQILCITHLPQVAMYGHTQYAVRKVVRDGRTSTEVVRLDGEARVEEIARMLGGKSLTESTLTHAREMLEKAAT